MILWPGTLRTGENNEFDFNHWVETNEMKILLKFHDFSMTWTYFPQIHYFYRPEIQISNSMSTNFHDLFMAVWTLRSHRNLLLHCNHIQRVVGLTSYWEAGYHPSFVTQIWQNITDKKMTCTVGQCSHVSWNHWLTFRLLWPPVTMQGLLGVCGKWNTKLLCLQ